MAAFTHLLCLILLIGVSTATSNKLLVLMIDGFRWDYFDFFEDDELPGFQQFMQTGVKAEYLQPAFPSYTFVNLYSLMTGKTPHFCTSLDYKSSIPWIIPTSEPLNYLFSCSHLTYQPDFDRISSAFNCVDNVNLLEHWKSHPIFRSADLPLNIKQIPPNSTWCVLA